MDLKTTEKRITSFETMIAFWGILDKNALKIELLVCWTRLNLVINTLRNK
jgi:hypothetical protein